MYKNVEIKEVGSYIPLNFKYNQFFIDHFRKYGKEEKLEKLLKKLGRNKISVAQKNENSITMSVKAAEKALNKAKVNSSDVDIIISASDTPEYLTPCCALIVKNKLKANSASVVFDVNSDCIGMLTAIDTAVRYLKTDKKYKRALIVGSLLINPFSREDDMVVYSAISDAASAIILEKKEEENERGFLGSRMFTDDTYNETIRFPACGLSNVPKKSTSCYDRKMEWKPFNFSFLSDKWSELITNLLYEHDYVPKDVCHYFMSQFSKTDVKATMKKLGTTIKNATFIGDEYGYTGCTSPIIALDRRLEEQKFRKNDIVVFCSVAGGYTMSALLYKW